MGHRSLGLLIVGVGVVAVIVGVVVWAGGFGWFGRLPGDLRFGSGRARVYVPLVSGLVVSVVLTIIVNVVVRWWLR